MNPPPPVVVRPKNKEDWPTIVVIGATLAIVTLAFGAFIFALVWLVVYVIRSLASAIATVLWGWRRSH